MRVEGEGELEKVVVGEGRGVECRGVEGGVCCVCSWGGLCGWSRSCWGG